MSKAILAAIPIKPFGVAKARLAPRLDAAARSQLGKAVAGRTAAAAADAGALVAIVTADEGVAAWSRSLGYLTISEPSPSNDGLNGAAETAMYEAARRHRPWAIIHADLPLVTPGSLRVVFSKASQQTVLVPSHDGGTNVVAGRGAAFRFSYGTSSFHRHLASHPHSAVLALPDLALDMDTAADLDRARRHATGSWLKSYVYRTETGFPDE